MNNLSSVESIIYHKNVIEFVTVATEVCLFLENNENFSYTDFVNQSVKLLPLLYLKTSILEIPESLNDELTERFVTEDDYTYVRKKTAQLLGSNDIYLEVFDQNMQYSDTPIAAFVSENLADIYQELKDFAINYSMEVTDAMYDSLVNCLENFKEHWGQKTLNALRALHALRYNDDFETYEDKNQPETEGGLDRNTVIDFLRDIE